MADTTVMSDTGSAAPRFGEPQRASTTAHPGAPGAWAIKPGSLAVAPEQERLNHSMDRMTVSESPIVQLAASMQVPAGPDDQASIGRRASKVTTSSPSVPVTEARPVANDAELFIQSSGLALVNKAVSKERPDGSAPELAPEHMSVLQQHCSFFDRDGDMVLWPYDTFIGFYRLGFPFIVSVAAMIGIHAGLSYLTQPGWLPDPFFRLYLANIHRCKHGSDTEVYDTEGRYLPQKFEEIFSKHDREGKGGLTLRDIVGLILRDANIYDPAGWMGAIGEWGATWWVARDERGVLTREAVRKMYDGSLWYEIAAKREGKVLTAPQKRTKTA